MLKMRTKNVTTMNTNVELLPSTTFFPDDPFFSGDFGYDGGGGPVALGQRTSVGSRRQQLPDIATPWKRDDKGCGGGSGGAWARRC